jgi:hypothetical protein
VDVQVRAFGEAALQTLLKSGASTSGPPPSQRDVLAETAQALNVLQNLLPRELLIINPAQPNGPHTPRHALLATSLEFQASLVANLVHAKILENQEAWTRCVGVYLGAWIGKEEGMAFAQNTRLHFLAIEKVSQPSRTLRILGNASWYRPDSHPGQMGRVKRKRFSATRSSLSRTVRCSCFPTRPFGSLAVAGTVCWAPTDPVSRP